MTAPLPAVPVVGVKTIVGIEVYPVPGSVIFTVEIFPYDVTYSQIAKRQYHQGHKEVRDAVPNDIRFKSPTFNK